MKHRIELFTDGVYSIIITLLVLELHTPAETGFRAWWDMLPILAAYLLTFALIGTAFQLSIFTMRQFREYSPAMLWVHIAGLATCGLMPLMLKNLIEHSGDPAALALFLSNPVFALVLLTIERYLAPKSFIIDLENWKAINRQRNIGLLLYVLGASISVGIGYLNFWAGFGAYCFIHLTLSARVAHSLSKQLRSAHSPSRE